MGIRMHLRYLANNLRQLIRSGIILSMIPILCAAATTKAAELSDIIASIKHSNDQLKDYQLQYSTKKTWVCDVQFDKDGQISGLTPKSDTEETKSKDADYKWFVKGSKLFYERDERDNINNVAYQTKHAFDGTKHLHLNIRPTFLISSGVVDPPNAYGSIPADVMQYDEFFRELRGRSILDWLCEYSVSVEPNKEELLDKSCYVINCTNKDGNQNARLWISPDCGFRALKMEYNFISKRWSTCITEIKEIDKGIWLPLRGQILHYIPSLDTGELELYIVKEMVVDSNSVKINKDIDDSVFVFEFPEGTRVHNRITNTMYTVRSEETNPKRPPIYQTDGKGLEQIHDALIQVSKNDKRILLMIGGNWCGWCYKLHDTLNNDQDIRKLIQKDYVLIMVDSTADKEVLRKWNIQPEAYPYLVVLDASAHKLTEQETGSLEKDGKHDPNKLSSFLIKWRSE